MGRHVTITSADGFEFSAYRSEPDRPATAAVVVIQEVFGVNAHIRAVTDRYAELGYLAIAPAIFDRIERGVELGYTPDDIPKGIDLARNRLNLDDAIADIAAAGRSVASVGKVGVVGYCFGGLLTALGAIRSGDVFSAASSYYGGNVTSLADQTPTVPMIMHFGERDHAIPIAEVHRLAASWPDVQVHIYDAEHGFNCDQRPSYDRAAAELAEQRTLAHFASYLA